MDCRESCDPHVWYTLIMDKTETPFNKFKEALQHVLSVPKKDLGLKSSPQKSKAAKPQTK